MNDSDSDRDTEGVVCSLLSRPDGKIRLVLDDARSEERAFPQEWKVLRLFTWRDFDAQTLLEQRLDEKALADIGLSVVVRLVALMETRKMK